MSRDSINLRGLTFLLADSNSFFSSVCHGMLRGFGAAKVIEVRDASQVVATLDDYKIDLMLCDARLPPSDAFELTHAIRSRASARYRTIPILIMAADTRLAFVHAARDCGANMMVAKPISPALLHDRLRWMLATRTFLDAPASSDSGRRFRRKNDGDLVIRESTGVRFSQGEIDNLLAAPATDNAAPGSRSNSRPE